MAWNPTIKTRRQHMDILEVFLPATMASVAKHIEHVEEEEPGEAEGDDKRMYPLLKKET